MYYSIAYMYLMTMLSSDVISPLTCTLCGRLRFTLPQTIALIVVRILYAPYFPSLFPLPVFCKPHTQDEERLLMVEQKRKMEEERRALEKAQKKAIKAQQDVILNRKGGRQRLSFTVTPKTD